MWKKKHLGPVRESNPGPLAPEARIIPLDQQAIINKNIFGLVGIDEDKKKGGDKYQPQPTSVQANTTQFKCT